MIQAISYIKIPAKIKSARKYSRMFPDSRNSRNFSSADDSRYTVLAYCYVHVHMIICDWILENQPCMHKDKYLETCNSVMQQIIFQECLELLTCNTHCTVIKDILVHKLEHS